MKPEHRFKFFAFLFSCNFALVFLVLSNVTGFTDRFICLTLGTSMITIAMIGFVLLNIHQDMLWISMHFSKINLEKIKEDTIKEFDQEAKNLTKKIDDKVK